MAIRKRTKVKLSPVPEKAKNKAVFFNRDGSLICDEGHDYIYSKENVKFNPGVITGIKRLREAGYLIFIVTNQGGIAKGIYTHEQVKNVHDYIQEELGKSGVTIDKIYYCPHHESIKTCVCRKPSPYMINLAIEEFNIDRRHSFLIGNNGRDIKAAEAAGIKPIKIHKNQDITSAINKILDIKTTPVNMNLDESEF